jgi:diaminopimelate decarboxylase
VVDFLAHDVAVMLQGRIAAYDLFCMLLERDGYVQLAYKHAEWSSQLPRVRPYYAVKCNDDALIVKTLSALGTGFDCATTGEISMALRQGVRPEDIIFAHPAKQPSHIR